MPNRILVKKRLESLISKYQANTLTRKEYEELIGLLENGGLNDLDGILDNAWDEEIATSGYKPFNKLLMRKLAVAAAVSLLIASFGWLWLNRESQAGFLVYQAPYGTVEEITLPDGSGVTLNANSQISWATGWESEQSRTVILEGEAFFDIKGLPGKIPFAVHAGGAKLVVVGTSFNVNTRAETLEVYLDEGRLDVHLEDGQSETINMLPGNHLQINTAEKKVNLAEGSSLIQSASWKKGILNFQDLSLEEVLGKLAHIYGKTFICSDSLLLTKEIYLGVPYSNWDTVKQALELSLNIHFEENEQGVTLEYKK